MKNELVEIPEVIISESGEKFLEKEAKLSAFEIAMQTIDSNNETIKAMDKELDRLRTESLQHSLAMQLVKGENRELKKHLLKFVEEFEHRFEVEKACDSPKIAEDYIDAAIYLLDNHQRTRHFINEVRAWMTGDTLPY